MIGNDKIETAVPASQTLPVLPGGPLDNRLIRLRESVLNWLSGATPDMVVNNVAVEMATPPLADLAVQLKSTLASLKAAAVDADGKRVDYAALRTDPAYAADRQTQLAALRQFDPGQLPESAGRAFWINLYNALVLDAVLVFEIQTSVIEGMLGVLTFFRRAAYEVGGQRVSLEDMEHGILRGNRGNPYLPGTHFATDDPRLAWALPVDPRLHFALNCGGRSCPPIRAYTAAALEQQLDLATRGYLDTAVGVQPAGNTVVLPRILRWFEKDFGGRRGVVKFLLAYLPEDDPRHVLLSVDEPQVTYAPYDWRLNAL